LEHNLIHNDITFKLLNIQSDLVIHNQMFNLGYLIPSPMFHTELHMSTFSCRICALYHEHGKWLRRKIKCSLNSRIFLF
jgi:hypothetical protein